MRRVETSIIIEDDKSGQINGTFAMFDDGQ
jgi:hypothetical protein